jgi:GTP-binding protein
MGFLKYAPVVFVSALKGTGVEEIFEAVKTVNEWREKWMPKEELSQIVRGVGESYTNVVGESRIRGGRQSGVDPARFHIYVRNAEKISPALAQILEDEIRSFYPYTGVPIFLKFIEEEVKGGDRKKSMKTTRPKRRS